LFALLSSDVANSSLLMAAVLFRFTLPVAFGTVEEDDELRVVENADLLTGVVAPLAADDNDDNGKATEEDEEAV
jgi:hypothetical protein